MIQADNATRGTRPRAVRRAPDSLDGEVCIEGLTRLSGGASRETWAFDAIGPDGARHALILRKDFEGAASQGLNLLLDKSERFDRAGEYAACVVLHDAGVPTPRPVCLPDPSTGLKGCFIMERLDGEALPRKLLHDDAYPDVRPTIAATLGKSRRASTALVRMHFPCFHPRRAEAASPDSEHARPGRPNAPHSPTVALMAAQSRATVTVGPEARSRRLPQRELPRHPDPVSRRARLGVRAPGRSNGRPRLLLHEAVAIRQPAPRSRRLRLTRGALEAYEAAGGEPVDLDVVRFWEVLGTVKWGALCTIRAMLHLSRMQRSVEAAAIGRRVAETEYDLIELIGRPPMTAARPTALELLETVEKFLQSGCFRSPAAMPPSRLAWPPIS